LPEKRLESVPLKLQSNDYIFYVEEISMLDEFLKGGMMSSTFSQPPAPLHSIHLPKNNAALQFSKTNIGSQPRSTSATSALRALTITTISEQLLKTAKRENKQNIQKKRRLSQPTKHGNNKKKIKSVRPQGVPPRTVTTLSPSLKNMHLKTHLKHLFETFWHQLWPLLEREGWCHHRRKNNEKNRPASTVSAEVFAAPIAAPGLCQNQFRSIFDALMYLAAVPSMNSSINFIVRSLLEQRQRTLNFVVATSSRNI